MRRALVALPAFLATLACGPTPRNQGDPYTSRSREQDMQGEAALGLWSDMPEAGKDAFSVLVANVGNIDFLRCDSAVYKLCDADQEARIAARIKQLEPDVALLVEVMNPKQCEALAATAPDWHVCHPDRPQGDQARRLLGDDYTIACEPRAGYECVGIRKAFGALTSCAAGGLCRPGLRTAGPFDGCDPGFTIAAATARIDERQVDLVVAHPPSATSPEAIACRRAYLPAALAAQGEDGSLRRGAAAIIGGDLNLDPWRAPTDADGAYFRERVGLEAGAAALRAHSGPVERDPPYWTALLLRRTLDHVASEGLVGRCITLGAAPDALALDLGQGTELQRLDHLAQYCVLSWAK